MMICSVLEKVITGLGPKIVWDILSSDLRKFLKYLLDWQRKFEMNKFRRYFDLDCFTQQQEKMKKNYGFSLMLLLALNFTNYIS